MTETSTFNRAGAFSAVSTAMRIDQAVASYGRPFNEIWEVALKDFREIASQYNISPATLFCVYPEWLDMVGKKLT